MENKKPLSILKVFIIIICTIFIALSLTTNIIFTRNNTPNIFGMYIHVVRDNAMEELVPQNYAVIGKSANAEEITNGKIVLCKLRDSNEIVLRSIYKVDTSTETGETVYYTTINSTDNVEMPIPYENIVALCSGYPMNMGLGKYIIFTTGVKGLILQLILPSVLLVIMLIIKIATAKDDEEDENYDFYEYEDEEENSNTQVSDEKIESQQPLFEPSNEPIAPSNEFERKKLSIAEHFSQKEVNSDSPYQKEKERTMQFKAQHANSPYAPKTSNPVSSSTNDNTTMFNATKSPLSETMQFRALSSAESSFAARNIGGQSTTAPTADALREEALRKNNLSKTAPLKNLTNAPKPSSNSNSPNIDDILNKSSNSKNNVKKLNSMSVEELLNMIENEKNKL